MKISVKLFLTRVHRPLNSTHKLQVQDLFSNTFDSSRRTIVLLLTNRWKLNKIVTLSNKGIIARSNSLRLRVSALTFLIKKKKKHNLDLLDFCQINASVKHLETKEKLLTVQLKGSLFSHKAPGLNRQNERKCIHSGETQSSINHIAEEHFRE